MGYPVKCCCYSPDGGTIAVGLNTGELQLLDAESLKTVAKKRDRNKPITVIR